MKVFVNIKRIGSRKNYISKEEINLSTEPLTLRELITEIIKINVIDFNERINKKKFIDYLTTEEIDKKITMGKVSFGEIYNKNEADVKEAVECALLAYEDGIYRVFIEDNETGGLDEKIELSEGDTLTFIRLMMLAGRMW
ncbi:MAG: hypothetical protein Q8900_05415 [Bacillota bacterium]|nr:hypothetical protein [Bacillota bacterium]